jgi:hypothetical protein
LSNSNFVKSGFSSVSSGTFNLSDFFFEGMTGGTHFFPRFQDGFCPQVTGAELSDGGGSIIEIGLLAPSFGFFSH